MLTLSRTRHRRRGVVLAVSLAAAAVALAGCSPAVAIDTETEPTAPEAAVNDALDLDADAVTGNGSSDFQGVDFPVPDGARSVTVLFECEGTGRFSVELGDSMMLGQSPLSGACDVPSQLVWPITEDTRPKLTVFIADGAPWTATPTFSAEEFAYDDALTVDCTAFAEVYSEFSNADSGVTFYNAIDDDEWTVRVENATSEFGKAAGAARSSVAPLMTDAYAIVSDRSPPVGQSLAGVELQIAEITNACNLNHTPLILRGEFGG